MVSTIGQTMKRSRCDFGYKQIYLFFLYNYFALLVILSHFSNKRVRALIFFINIYYFVLS